MVVKTLDGLTCIIQLDNLISVDSISFDDNKY